MLVSAHADELGWSVLLDNAFTLTLLLLFVAVVIATLVRRYRRDKCLALFDDFHVTFADASGRATWGDLVVVPDGLQVRFDDALREPCGLTKTSVLIYDDALHCGVGLCRSVDALTPDERELREQELRHSVRPGPVRQVARALVNLLIALRDSMARALTLAVDQIKLTIPFLTALGEQARLTDALSATSEHEKSRSYEPLLERCIGKPVVLRLVSAADPEHPIELPGYLVEYTADYVAVFNVQREPSGELELELHGDHQGCGFAVEWRPPWVRIRCTGPDVLVVREVHTAARVLRPECALLRGAFAEIRTGDVETCWLRLRLTRRVDVVCPRARAVVTHGGELDEADRGA